MLKTTSLAVWLLCVAAIPVQAGNGPRPDILLVTVDTLRADRLSGMGYDRLTTPAIDRLLESSVSFSQARTVEPLTSPALTSILTGLHPHEHGATRNGIPMRPGLDSLPRSLEKIGYRTAAFVGSWVLRERLSGLDEHFDHYEEVLTRKRWFGLVRKESTAEDLNERSLDWLGQQSDLRPVFLWVHYVEPHAPYRSHPEYSERLGFTGKSLNKSERYDTEIAFVDEAVGGLIEAFRSRRRSGGSMVIFTSDHGESLGEHDYWGHGQHLYDVTLRVPLAIGWQGHLEPGIIAAPATLLDLAPTVLALLGLPAKGLQRGADWTDVMGGAPEPTARATLHQAHKGAVQQLSELDRKRRRGLLEVARIAGGRKEIFRPNRKERKAFDLAEDPSESLSLVPSGSEISGSLADWLDLVHRGLVSADDLPAGDLTEEDRDRLRSLGYLE